jgi:hypothetical protein
MWHTLLKPNDALRRISAGRCCADNERYIRTEDIDSESVLRGSNINRIENKGDVARKSGVAASNHHVSLVRRQRVNLGGLTERMITLVRKLKVGPWTPKEQSKNSWIGRAVLVGLKFVESEQSTSCNVPSYSEVGK